MSEDKRRQKFRRENRPFDPVAAAEWDKAFDFYYGAQWTPEQQNWLQGLGNPKWTAIKEALEHVEQRAKAKEAGK